MMRRRYNQLVKRVASNIVATHGVGYGTKEWRPPMANAIRQVREAFPYQEKQHGR